MDDLAAVFDFAATVIGLFLSTMLSHWFTTILIFMGVLSLIVAVFLATRGDR